MNRYKCVLLLMCLSLTLAQASDNQPDAAFVSKVEGLGQLIDVVQTPQGYASLSRTIQGGFVFREMSNSGQRILENRIWNGLLTGFAKASDGYVFVGWEREYNDYYYDIDNSGFVFKLNNDGVYKWSKRFNFESSGITTNFDSVSSKPDGGFVVTGRQSEPTAILIISFTSNGDVLWKKRIKKLFTTNTYFSQRVTDGIILASGRKILKINDSGNIVWKKTLKVPDLNISSLGTVSNTNGVVVAGNLVGSKLQLIGLDANGKVDWSETYSLSMRSDLAPHLLQTPDGGYVIAGTTQKGGQDGMLLKIDARRDVVFKIGFGGSGNQKVYSVFSKNKGGYALFSSNSPKSEMVFSSLNPNGIVPGCSSVNNLTINKVGSPKVTTEQLDIEIQNFSLPTPDAIQVRISNSLYPSASVCP